MQTTASKPSQRRRNLLIAALVVAVIVAGVVIWQLLHKPKPIHDFAGCVDAGYPVADSFPETCSVPKVGTFINPDQRVDTSVAPAKTNLNLTTLVISNNLGPVAPKQIIITTEADWEKYWVAAHANLPVMPPLIAVDFSKEMVVAVQAGQKVSTGYSIKITDISEDAHGLEIDVRLSTPGKNCQPKEPPTNPYHIIRTLKVDKPADFRLTTQAVDCSV